MRLITDEQHAQIVELLETLSIYVTASTHPRGQLWREDMRDATKALATLQALPTVGVVGFAYPAMYSKNTMVRITKDGLGNAKLYATKDKT